MVWLWKKGGPSCLLHGPVTGSRRDYGSPRVRVPVFSRFERSIPWGTGLGPGVVGDSFKSLNKLWFQFRC